MDKNQAMAHQAKAASQHVIGGTAGYMTANTPPSQPNIHVALDRNGDYIAELHDVLSELTVRLSSALMLANETNGPDRSANSVALVERVLSHGDRIKDATEVVRDLLSRLVI